MSDDVKTDAELRLEARLAILKMVEIYAKGMRINEAYDCFCYQYNSESIEVEPWIRAKVKTVSRGSLYNWRALVKKSRIYALSRSRGSNNRAYTGVLDQIDDDLRDELKLMVIELMDKQKHLKYIPISNYLKQYFPEAPDASARTWRRAIKKWKKEMDEDKAKTHYKA